MIRKFITAAILIPLTLVILAFALANREIVTLSFDPFDAANPAFAAKLPLFILIFGLVILGVVIGGVASWRRQSKWRRAARRLDSDVRDLHAENVALRRRLAEAEPAHAAPVSHVRAAPPSLRLRPPAA
jgi:uncharacterized integral membrane protein